LPWIIRQTKTSEVLSIGRTHVEAILGSNLLLIVNVERSIIIFSRAHEFTHHRSELFAC